MPNRIHGTVDRNQADAPTWLAVGTILTRARDECTSTLRGEVKTSKNTHNHDMTEKQTQRRVLRRRPNLCIAFGWSISPSSLWLVEDESSP